MRKQVDRQKLKKNQLRWMYFIIFISLLVVILTPRKKENVVLTPVAKLETEIKEKVDVVADKALVEKKAEVKINNSVSQTTIVVSAPVQKIFDPAIVSQKRSQAKSTLATMYSALTSFYNEHERYTTDLYAAGFSLYGNTQSIKTGFINESRFISDQYNQGTGESKDRMNSDFFVYKGPISENNKPTYTKEAEKINFRDYEKFCRNKCTADENSFEIISIIPFDDDHVDVWLMNERKELIQVQDGLQGL